MDKSNNIIGSRILELRTRAGEKQEELAQVIHCNRGSLSNYEKGARTPDAYTIALIAKHYSVTSDYLLGLTDTPSTNRDIAFISDYTGLDEDIIQDFHEIKKRNSPHKKDYSDEHFRLLYQSIILNDEYLTVVKRMRDILEKTTFRLKSTEEIFDSQSVGIGIAGVGSYSLKDGFKPYTPGQYTKGDENNGNNSEEE